MFSPAFHGKHSEKKEVKVEWKSENLFKICQSLGAFLITKRCGYGITAQSRKRIDLSQHEHESPRQTWDCLPTWGEVATFHTTLNLLPEAGRQSEWLPFLVLPIGISFCLHHLLNKFLSNVRRRRSGKQGSPPSWDADSVTQKGRNRALRVCSFIGLFSCKRRIVDCFKLSGKLLAPQNEEQEWQAGDLSSI